MLYVSAFLQYFIIVPWIAMEIHKIDSIEIDVKITMCGDKIEEKIIH